MINEAELRELSPGERRELARMLAAIDYPRPLIDLSLRRGRRIGAGVSTLACAALVAWIVVLALTLRRSATATHWQLAWVGFDIVLLAAFAMTGWAFWRGRQIVIAFLLITGTLLCCDAWFDVILDIGTPDLWTSIGSAVVVELPLAAVLLSTARRLIRLSALTAMGSRPGDGERMPLWRIPLLGEIPRPPRPPGPSRPTNPGKIGHIAREASVAPAGPEDLA